MKNINQVFFILLSILLVLIQLVFMSFFIWASSSDSVSSPKDIYEEQVKSVELDDETGMSYLWIDVDYECETMHSS